MSHALFAAGDGIAGPAPYVIHSRARTDRGPDDLSYLMSGTRSAVMIGDLMMRCGVETDVDGGVRLAMGGTDIAKVSLKIEAKDEKDAPVLDPAILGPQMAYLRSYADLRGDRIGEIDVQLTDIISFLGAGARLDGGARRNTLELLHLVQDVAYMLTMAVKHRFRLARPVDLDPRVHPIIPTPDHSSFPSGHSTESFAVATVLTRLMGRATVGAALDKNDIAFQAAHRVAVNRTVAGVHYPMDNAVGGVLGVAIGEALCAMAGAGKGLGLRFDLGGCDATYSAADDFELSWLRDQVASGRDVAVGEVGLMKTFWARAADEWPEPAE
ncbi:MAG: phosphatase PAP2 family protein [Pseudomonadota bacterium]